MSCVFDKDANIVQLGRRIFSINVTGIARYSHAKG